MWEACTIQNLLRQAGDVEGSIVPDYNKMRIVRTPGHQQRYVEGLHEAHRLRMACDRQVEAAQPVVGQRVRACGGTRCADCYNMWRAVVAAYEMWWQAHAGAEQHAENLAGRQQGVEL